MAPTFVTGARPDLSAGVNRFDYVVSHPVEMPSAGGQVDLRIWVPPTTGALPTLGLLFFGLKAQSPLPLPYHGSPLGLDPNGFLLVVPVVLVAEKGFGSAKLLLPPMPKHLTLREQCAYFGLHLALLLAFGSTSEACTT